MEIPHNNHKTCHKLHNNHKTHMPGFIPATRHDMWRDVIRSKVEAVWLSAAPTHMPLRHPSTRYNLGGNHLNKKQNILMGKGPIHTSPLP